MDHLSSGTLQGRVSDINGTPIPQLRLLVLASGKTGKVKAIRSNDTGDYEVSNFDVGSIKIQSRTEPAIDIDGLEIEAGEVKQRDLIVDIGTNSITGFVQSMDGAPLGNSKVKMVFEYVGEADYKCITSRSATTSEEGNFRFIGLGSGVRQLTITAEGHVSKKIQLDPQLDPGPHQVDLELEDQT